MKRDFIVLGGMAGSSMDGLDLALVNFSKQNEAWLFELLKCKTFAYPDALYKKLKEAQVHSLDFQNELDIKFGYWLAKQINDFLTEESLPGLLAIHGHTICHSPKDNISWQLGKGSVIANETAIPTVTDFRTKDIELGGQGAPLVPFGDFELFGNYDACLNLGGIANLSNKSTKTAGDICPCNQVLNYYANKLGHAFDEAGKHAKQGILDNGFLTRLEKIPFFKESFPKSLPNHFISKDLLDSVTPETGLRSYTEFIATQIAKVLKEGTKQGSKILITGGGAFNSFLISRIKKLLSQWQIVLPTDDLVSYKEAIIFAFLGLMKMQEKVNVLSSVTGAKHDNSSGVIHLPK